MQRPAQGDIPGRPNRPLVVRCGYDGTTRRVQFPSAATCRLESLRTRVEECFALSAWRFFLTYTDDDGDEFSIKSEDDLTEAIAYFVSGDDDHGASPAMGAGMSLPAPKVAMRVDVVVEYDGPSLSDTSSIASFPSERSYSSRSGRSYDSRSYRSRASRSTRDSRGGADDTSTLGRRSVVSDISEAIDDHLGASEENDTAGLPSPMTPRLAPSSARAAASAYSGGGALSHRIFNSNPTTHEQESQYREPYRDEGPPSLLTSSELGSRWLREQSQLASRLPRLRISDRQYDSDESLSDEESLGDIALVRDARGRYYYSYQTETQSLWSRSDAEFDAQSIAGPSRSTSYMSANTTARLSPPESPEWTEVARTPEPMGAPILAPDCSACGIRLEYMRYACTACGEGDMWTVNAAGKAPFVPPRMPTESDDTSSEGTAGWVRARSHSSHTSGTTSIPDSSAGSQTVYTSTYGRSRSGSISTNASRTSLAVTNGSAASPTSPHFLSSLDMSPFDERRTHAPRGYELCPGCIEVHGIAHAKAAAKAAREDRDANGRRRKRSRLRHTFREMVWGAEGWIDVGEYQAITAEPADPTDYAEDSECTICRSVLFHNRFKCVSCPKFDLCRSCYQKVEEIHPVHVFLSLPDKPLPQLTPPPSNGGRSDRVGVETRPVRHPGAFCHNCLQDIVGPRFHCAVCPSWDLCIQCEGVSAPGDGQHTADHIMMKIPIPLASAEVEAVSRRARDRWFQQDSSTVARSAMGTAMVPAAPSQSSRSSSPTIDTETVYAADNRGTAPSQASGRGTPSTLRSHATVLTVRDDLDHNARCANCNEWIMGRRYQCANCPSDPEPYNLCSICELRSYRLHDPRHVFFKFDRPVHIPLQSPFPFLPLLYKSRVGQVPATAVLNPRDPTAYLKHVLHRDTLCDIHSDQIRGIWLRCTHCAAGFDICSEAEQVADHDATHVFVVFKARVDMAAFRRLADLAATHSKPLLSQQVYLH